MLHPQDFSTENQTVDYEKYQEFIKFLEHIKRSDISVHTLTQYKESHVDFQNYFNRDLSFGMKGPDVFKLQQQLNQADFRVAQSGFGSPGKETYFFGEKTKSALIKFQEVNKIHPALGIYDAKSKSILQK